MAKYGVQLTRTGNVVTVGTVGAAAATVGRGRLYDLTFGCDAAPADATFIWQVCRTTAYGTNTAITPARLDAADVAWAHLAGHIHTVEPTYTGVDLLAVPMNQRTTYRWVAQPGGELVWASSNNDGFGIRHTSASATTMRATVHIDA
jgi:hypothetical protein